MKNGCLPLTKDQIESVTEALDSGTYALRNQVLFLMGCYTGFRIAELLSLKVGNVAGSFITVDKRNTKGKTASRRIPIHPAYSELLAELIASKAKTDLIFQSRQGDGRAVDASQGTRIVQAAFRRVGLEGKYSTHTMRKTFALMLWEKSGGNILAVKEGLGHKSVATTQEYLKTVIPEMDALILSL